MPTKMVLGVARETSPGEVRPLLLPQALQHFAALSLEVLVERGLGRGIGVADEEYAAQGPFVRLASHEEVWQASTAVFKLKRPSPEELALLPEGATIAALFHAEGASDLVEILLRRRLRAYSYEYFADEDGVHPLMAATGEIAGKQAIIYAAYHLQTHLGGSGRLLSTTQYATPTRVAVLGYGNVGRAAAKLASLMGAETFVFRWQDRHASTPSPVGGELTFLPWNAEVAAKLLPTCDVIIGAIRISTYDTAPFLTRELVKSMRPGSVIVDVTAGYGSGFIESSDALTTFSSPTITRHGVSHVKIRQLPRGVPVTSAEQISACYAPHLALLARALATGTLYEVAERGKIVEAGSIVHTEVRRHYEANYREAQ